MTQANRQTNWVASARADAWNANWPEGTEVVVVDDFGERSMSTTRSEAWLLGGDAVVLVEGKSGGYALDRLVPVNTTIDARDEESE